MPSDYTGIPTATQAPSPMPGPGAAPIVHAPSDGDPLNVSSILQDLKTLADFEAWLTLPTAIPLSWEQEVLAFRDALGVKRFRVDHLGHPSGNVVVHRETWRGINANAGGTVTFDQTNLLYGSNVTTSGLGLHIEGPDAKNATRHLVMDLGAGGSDFMNLSSQPVARFDTGRAVVMEGTLRTDSQINQCGLVWGLALGSGWLSDPPVAGFTGALIYLANSAAWKFVVGDGTNMSTPVILPIACAVDTEFRLRLEFVGSGVADNSITATRVYINGVLQATETIVLPSASATPYGGPVLSLKRTTGSSPRVFYVGPYQITVNDS